LRWALKSRGRFWSHFAKQPGLIQEFIGATWMELQGARQWRSADA
jgi:hypothetical protein